MALAQLTPEETRTWTREEKDRWWLENIYRGNLPQLTLRSGLTGFLLGGVLSATNLYVGGKTGVTLGVNLTSVILAFALFRLLSRLGLASNFTILENNAMQSIATAAGYMTTPLISSLAAYMLITGVIVPWWQMVLWMVVMSIVGVLVAFPMKRRFINEDQLPFPEGRACGVLLDALYTGAAGEGMYKARLLAITAGLTAFYQFLTAEALQRLLQFRLFGLDRIHGWTEPWRRPGCLHRDHDYREEKAVSAFLGLDRAGRNPSTRRVLRHVDWGDDFLVAGTAASEARHKGQSFLGGGRRATLRWPHGNCQRCRQRPLFLDD